MTHKWDYMRTSSTPPQTHILHAWEIRKVHCNRIKAESFIADSDTSSSQKMKLVRTMAAGLPSYQPVSGSGTDPDHSSEMSSV
ncbi:hypothetical protein V9T40_000379 [Parthenolecanium corni]|uniref:Uncharacterized protein n=1 Tax=Parthenolecanium corni TaxID=536013 RepID=A0AAN9T9P3_9HEMI